MLKAKCSKCFGSISAPETYAGRTVKCPKCLGPVAIPNRAAAITAQIPVSTAGVVSADPALEKCGNCIRTIGQLEQAFLWEENVVCGDCYSKLQNRPRETGAVALPPPLPPTIRSNPASAPAPRQLPASKMSRFMRGGLLGLISEDFCVSANQIKIGGNTTEQKAKRLAILVGSTVLGFVVLIVIVVVAGNSSSRSSESHPDSYHYTPPRSFEPTYVPHSTPAYTPPVVEAEPQRGYLSTHEKAEWVRQNDQGGTFSDLSDEQAARLYDNMNRATGGQ